jgi:hypothetical protein
MMKFRRLSLLLCFLTVIKVSSAAAEVPSPGGDASALSLETLHSSREKQQALARYAKGIFLHRLGFGPAVYPPSWMTGIQSACFVTFFARKRVIACSGGFRPRTADLGKEVEANVRQALHLDPRAGYIDRAAAAEARVLITFPGELRPVASPALIDPLREGLFVENDRSGVAIVPGEAKTSAWAYREALRRLGESDPTRVRLYAFDSWVISGKD